MGYYTYYTIKVAKTSEDVAYGDFLEKEDTYQYANSLHKITQRYYNEPQTDLPKTNDEYMADYFENLFFDSCKWYEHDTDMLELSRMYPDMWFEVTGDGEEYEDLWKKYYHNGKMQECRGEIEITYDPFMPEYLE